MLRKSQQMVMIDPDNGELPNAALRANPNAWNYGSSTSQGNILNVRSVKLCVECTIPSRDAGGI